MRNKISVALLLLVVLSLSACGSVKNRKIVSPFVGDEYVTSRDFLRATASATSLNTVVATNISRANAQSEMASSLSELLGSVVQIYIDNHTAGGDELCYAEALAKLTKRVATVLPNVSIKGRKTFVKDGKFTCWTVLEMPTNDVMNRLKEAVLSYNNEITESSQEEPVCSIECDFLQLEKIFKKQLQLLEGK